MRNVIFVILFLSLITAPGMLYAMDITQSISGIEVLSGYFGIGQKDLEETQSTYEGVPLFVGVNFDVKPLAEKIGIRTAGRLDFVLEPFANAVLKPNDNIEAGSNFLLKYVFPLSKKFQPYIKGGEGISYMSQHTKEQSTQYNFLSQAAAGFHYFINDSLAVTMEYRYRHLSNAGIEKPNNGINTDFVLGGITYYFKQ
ncbi:MAG: acyloxyacyl hydrolase [Candidatus Omnitrophica bacterium]|nr:acyloxyacyl hydrolase [Candidatus Omnitrophota bacterium]